VHQGLFSLTLAEFIALGESIAPTSRKFTELVGRIVRDVPLPQRLSDEDMDRVRQAAAGPHRQG